jgi:cell division protein FtsL
VTRVNIVIGVLLLACAFGLVTSQHRARRLFIDVERAHARAQQLEVQWDQLQLEQTGLAKSSLIDAKARRDLGMQPPTADRTLHMSIDVLAQARAREARR